VTGSPSGSDGSRTSSPRAPRSARRWHAFEEPPAGHADEVSGRRATALSRQGLQLGQWGRCPARPVRRMMEWVLCRRRSPFPAAPSPARAGMSPSVRSPSSSSSRPTAWGRWVRAWDPGGHAGTSPPSPPRGASSPSASIPPDRRRPPLVAQPSASVMGVSAGTAATSFLFANSLMPGWDSSRP
jgi:hypothetical protein